MSDGGSQPLSSLLHANQTQKENIKRKISLQPEDVEVMHNPVIGTVFASVFTGFTFKPDDPDAVFKEGSLKYVQSLAAIIKVITVILLN